MYVLQLARNLGVRKELPGPRNLQKGLMPPALRAHGRKTQDLGTCGPQNALQVKHTCLPSCPVLRHGVGSRDGTGWKPVGPVPTPTHKLR